MINKILSNLRKKLEYYKDRLRMNNIKKELLSRGFSKEFVKFIFTLAKSDTFVAVSLGLWYINKGHRVKSYLLMSKLVDKYYDALYTQIKFELSNNEEKR